MPFDLSDYKRFVCNSLDNSQYMTNMRTKKFMKDFDENIDKAKVNTQTIKDFIYDADYADEILTQIGDYEYDKYYKYFMLKMFAGNYNKLLDKVKKLLPISKECCASDLSCFEVKEYGDSFDIKFKLVKAMNPQYADGQMYPVIITFLKEHNILAIKYSAKPFQEYKESFYSDTIDSVVRWLNKKLDLNCSEYNSFEKLECLMLSIEKNPDIHIDKESIEVIKYEDENNGTTSFRANEDDKLPLLDTLKDLASGFCEKDKEKINDFIISYKENSRIPKLGIKFKHNFKSSNGHVGSITIVQTDKTSIEQNSYPCHIYSQQSINREKIDYVIKYILEFQNQNSSPCKD